MTAKEAAQRDKIKHNCYAHAGYNTKHQHVCLRCGQPITADDPRMAATK